MNKDKPVFSHQSLGFGCLMIALLGIWFVFKSLPLPTTSHPYPMIRSGGLFLAMIGTGIILGTIFPRYLWHFFGISLFVASTALTFAARSLTAPLGMPTRFQIGVLIFAVVVEFALIVLLPRFFPPRNEAGFQILVLLSVGIHFLIMIPAFGPQIAVLGLLTIVNAGIGIWKTPQIRFQNIWGIDGILKLVIGTLMLCFPFIGF
jgi:hypothetical protein